MEKDGVKVYKPSSGDANKYYRETSAADHIVRTDSSAQMGNLADALKRGPVAFPNVLAPDIRRYIPVNRTVTPKPK